MYESYYGLNVRPFQLNPDPVFYFSSKQHNRAKAYLEYGVLRNEGFIVITGEIGAGKTTIVRGLLDSLDADKVIAGSLVSTQLDADDTLRLVAAAFGVRFSDVSKADILLALEAFFVTQATQGKRCLLVVDEAQNLTPRAVEELRMLSNFQYGKQALLQSFLVGQPEFREVLQHPQMQQLRQRVIAACHIGSMDLEETQGYILHRLKCAGSTGRPVFESAAFDEIFNISGGIPRRINAVCDRLLLLGFLENREILTSQDVATVASEIREESGSSFNGLEFAKFNDLREEKIGSSIRGALAGSVNSDLLSECSQRMESLGKDLSFQKLEQSLLRLEHSNGEIILMLKQFFDALNSNSKIGGVDE
jgi:general secretion pathway protein A